MYVRLYKLSHQCKDQVYRRLIILFPQLEVFFAEIIVRNTGYNRLHPFHSPIYIALADILHFSEFCAKQ